MTAHKTRQPLRHTTRPGPPPPNVARSTGSGNLAEPVTPLARRLRHQREHAGLTRLQLAGRLGTWPSRICDWEIGINTPTLPTLQRYAAAFEITVSELLDGVM